MSQEQQLKLQSLADERTKALETLSNLMKAESAIANSITDNLN